MANIGVNVDPLNPSGAPSMTALQEAGFTWVRLVDRPGVEAYVSQCQAAGIRVLAVIAKESFVDGVPHVLNPAPDAYQLGNEPDGTGASSWSMSPEEYVALWTTWAPQLDAPVVAAGLCSDDPAGWMRGVVDGLDPPPHALAVHPYGATPDDAQALFDAFAEFQLPVWLTEWNLVPREDLDAASVQTDLMALWETFDGGAEATFWFCWSDGMVAGLGLVDGDGQRKSVYQAFNAAVSIAAA